MIRIDRNPSRRQLNVFGAIWLIFFGTIGAVLLYRGHSFVIVASLWVMAVVVPLVGWLKPAFMRIVYLGMSYAAWAHRLCHLACYHGPGVLWRADSHWLDYATCRIRSDESQIRPRSVDVLD